MSAASEQRAEARGYSRGYVAGRARRERDMHEAEAKATAGAALFTMLVAGLIAQGLSVDDILDAQLIGARSIAA